MTNETPRIWAATIEQVGALVVVGVQFVVMQHLYATYLERKPESSWLVKTWTRYTDWKERREIQRIGWINSPRETTEPTPA